MTIKNNSNLRLEKKLSKLKNGNQKVMKKNKINKLKNCHQKK